MAAPSSWTIVTDDSTVPVDGVLLVTVDSLRADAVGGGESHSPRLDTLAKSGARFENAFATGNWTPFSFPSILGQEHVFAEGPDIGIASGPTLAETFATHDVRTAGFNAANGFLTAHWGYDRGYDEFETFTESDGTPYGRYLAAHPTVQGWVQLLSSPFRRIMGRLKGDDRPQFLDASRLIDVESRATSFLESVDGPFFLWVHYMDTHTPYVPAPRYLRKVTQEKTSTLRMLRAHLRTGLGLEVNDRTLADLKALYDATVRQVDASVGRLLDTLDSEGLREDTTVVVAGDHGEEFMDHGHLAHYPKLYDELTHVPLIVDHPNGESRSIEEPTSLDVIPPTLLDAAGLSIPAGFDGESVLQAVIDGEDPDTDVPISVAVRGDSVTQQPIPKHLDEGNLLVSARSADWTYIHHTGPDSHELYDRRTDETEQEDLWPDAREEPGVETLRDAAQSHIERIEDGRSSGKQPDTGDTPDGVEQRLTALGYQ
ncbi:sulfatase [Halanaeroarchaeum sulfurireducens]|uniref:sulfatase n=1 Tax=Halanaeroarchaeum sulfurireducens TaxID=1604004 RepID=UPI0006794823